MEDNEREYLEELRADSIITLSYFGEPNKSERERAACRAFLRCVGIMFQENELVAPSDEPTDVAFRRARFQVYELLENGRRRGDELRNRADLLNEAGSIDDTLVDFIKPVGMSGDNLVTNVCKGLEAKALKYGFRQCSTLDALVYVNLRGRFLLPVTSFGPSSNLQAQGWRSVSAVFPPYGIVLQANASASEMISSIAGKALAMCSNLDTLFNP